MSWIYTCDICKKTFDAESPGCDCYKELTKAYLAVDKFAHAMKLKLAKAAEKGKRGWDDKETCSDEHLANLFFEHLAKCNKGNFIDLANFLMFLHVRGAKPSVLANVENELHRLHTLDEENEKVAIALLQKIGERA